MPKEIAFALKTAVGDTAEVLVVPGKSHGGAWRDGTAAYSEAAAVVLKAAENGADARVATHQPGDAARETRQAK